ncbi:MAG: response regulator transcription factor [Bacteroidales bacterium]|nr:response regulator transcription factor [Bacteroidales bacterium]
MKCLVVEDEKIAADRLCALIGQADSNIEVQAVLQSVKKSVEWLNANTHPDIIFSDIHLSDGLSFEIFRQTAVNSAVIFTTAYDEYALRAFKVNSIDYLLKPIDLDELKSAIEKFKSNRQPIPCPRQIFEGLLHSVTNTYKSKFVMKVGEHLKVFETDEVQCFYSMEKAVFLQTLQGRDYAIPYSLDQLEGLLDPSKFFRINRKYIVSFKAIKDILSYSNSRLLLRLVSNNSDDLIISRERAGAFKAWLEK